MRTQRTRNEAPRAAAAFALAAVLLSATSADADGAPVPDSSGWTVEQAVVNLRASDRGMRLAALNRLAPEPGPTIQQWISEAARYDPEARIRYEAVMILGRRQEPESLPVLVFISENDADDRVRAAARTAAQAAGAFPSPAPAPAVEPEQPPPAHPAPAPPPPKRYDDHGHELPPGYLDGGPPPRLGAAASFDSPLGRPVLDDSYIDRSRREVVHHGFIPSLGYDGAIGAPRDTLARTRVGLQLGFAHSGTTNTATSGEYQYLEIEGFNDFSFADFSVLIDGTWSPWDFLELGLSLEVLTVERLVHEQIWIWAEGMYEGEFLDTDFPVHNDASYSGAALGFLSLDLKTLLHRSELLRLGLALRVTFPTHTGERFESGIGAPMLFLPTRTGRLRDENRTRDGALWGLEPGIVFSLAPVPRLTVYGDLIVAMTILNYTWYRETPDPQPNSMSAFNVFLIPALGAQYRLLDETLGVQLAVQPAIYLGAEQDSSLASFGFVPGVSYRLIEHLDISLALNIEAGGDAPRSSLCTDVHDQHQPSVPCGVGRRMGLALKTSWVF